MYCCNTQTKFYESEKQLVKDIDITWGATISDASSSNEKEVQGYATSCRL